MASPFDDIFGGSGPQWTWDQMQARLDAAITRERLPRDLVYALVKQESNWDPYAVGDGGRAKGFFQLHPGAAKDAGIDPAHRDDIGLNIDAGTRYLRLKLDQARGDEDKALRLYNGGGDPNYVTNVRRHMAQPRAQPTMLSRAASILSPASAEAAPSPQGTSAAVWDDIFGTQSPPSAQAPPSPPTARSTPEEAAAYRTWARQQAQGTTQPPAPVSQTTPTSATAPGGSQTPPGPTPADEQYAAGTIAQMRQRQAAATPEARLQQFQQLPAITALSPEERHAAVAEFQGLQEAQQRAILASEPAADITTAVQEGPRLTPEQQLQKRPAVLPSQLEAPLEEQNPVQKWIDTGLDIGYGVLGGIIGGSTGGVPGMIAGPVVAQGLLDRARMQLGIRPQEKALFEAGPINVYQSDLLNAGVSLLLGTPDIVRSVLSRSKAGQAIRAADDATRAAHEEWKSAVQEARAAQQAQVAEADVTRQGVRREAYQAAERKALDANARYQERVQAREQTIRENQQAYDDALAQYKQEVEQTRTQAYRERSQEITQQQAQYQGQVARQTSDIAAQGQAIQTARAVPGRYAPETPSWVLYEKFGDVAKNEVVDLAPAKAGLAEVRASRGVLPDGTARPFPSAVEQIAASLEKAEGTVSVQTIRDEMRRLGPLTRSPNGDIRGPAKQLYGLYADALEASPVANDLLRQANATFRREMALQDISEWLRPGRGIVRIDQQGRETINVGALLTRLEKTVGEDTLFARSFTPDDLAALRQDFGALAGTPRMPTGTPRAPTPEFLPGSAADVPARLQEAPTPPGMPAEVQRPRRELLPGGAGQGRQVPEPPPPRLPEAPVPVTPREALGPRPTFGGARAGTWGAILGSATAMGVPLKITAPAAAVVAAHASQKQIRWLLANALLDPKRRGLMQAAMDSQGRLDRRIYGVLQATLSAAEKRQYLRETR